MPPPGAGTWTDPAWRAGHLDWVRAALADAGRNIAGRIVQAHVRPWSTLFTIPTDEGTLWSKAAGPGTRHEAGLLERLAAWDMAHVLRPLAVDVERGWVLLPDGGTRLRDQAPDLTGDHDLAAWEALLPEYAGLQRSLETRTDALLAAGVPDEPPAAIPAILARLLDDDRIWTRVDADERVIAGQVRADLVAWLPEVTELAGILAASGVPMSVDHGDLHGGNVLLDQAGTVRFFDWGDSVVGHPFATLTTTLGSIAPKVGLAADGPELGRLRDAYTEAWTDVAARSDLAAAADLAVDLGYVNKAAAWERALLGIAPEAMEGHHGATAETLLDLRDRLKRRLGRPRAATR